MLDPSRAASCCALNFIDGEWQAPASGAELAVTDPATLERHRARGRQRPPPTRWRRWTPRRRPFPPGANAAAASARSC
jgi:hypothetical protein